nr:hypothetical protein [uncultured Roseococcus sp.]
MSSALPIDTNAPIASAVPTAPNANLSRPRLSAALTETGFPIKESTLATLAVRGGGPQFRKFGRAVLYRWDEALAWAESKLSGPMSSTAEVRARRTTAEAARQAAAAPLDPNAFGQPESRTKAR